MIQAAAENKYSFNMQVSVKAMAVPDRDLAALKELPWRSGFLRRPFNQLGCAATARRADGIPPATSVNGRVSRIRYGFRQPASVNERPLPRGTRPMQLAYRPAL
jgi:hypothetical protein